MPNRIVREGIISSVRVEQLKWDEEVFYRRLHSIVDDYGRCESLPMWLKSRCFPLRDYVRVSDIARWIAACVKAGLILEYGVSGKRYLQVIDFRQQVRTPSKYPAPPDDELPLFEKSCAANEHVVVSVSGGVVVIPPKGGASPAAPAPDAIAETAWGIWIVVNRQRGRKDPVKLGPDLSASKRLWKALNGNAEEFRNLCKAYLNDGDRFIVAKGHALQYLEANKYSNAPGTGLARPKPLPDVSEITRRQAIRDEQLRREREADRRLRESRPDPAATQEAKS